MNYDFLHLIYNTTYHHFQQGEVNTHSRQRLLSPQRSPLEGLQAEDLIM